MHLSPRLRVPLAGLALCSAALLISACGGSSSSDKTTETGKSFPANAVAIVGTETVPRSKLNAEMTRTCLQYKAANKTCPKPGSPARRTLQQNLVQQFVTNAEFRVAAKQLKVSVTQKAIDAQLKSLQLQYAKAADGTVDLKKWKKVLADNHTTQVEVLETIKDRLLQDALYKKVTGKATVTDADVTAYYTGHKSSYAIPPSREVRHILVKTKALADKIYGQLATSDAKFAALAKQYSTDPGSKVKGGKLGKITKGQTVPAFDKVAFSAATGKVAKPVKSAYGWHVIEATAATVPAGQKPLDKALKTEIRTSLLNQKKQTVANKWLTAFQKKIEKQVRYASGLKPVTTSSTASTATGTATEPTATTTAG